jgi:hypothetical protein
MVVTIGKAVQEGIYSAPAYIALFKNPLPNPPQRGGSQTPPPSEGAGGRFLKSADYAGAEYKHMIEHVF